MSERPMDEMLEQLREGYNAPPETPRDEMWQAIEARMAEEAGEAAPGVVSLTEARRRRRPRWYMPAAWTAAAAAVLVMGVGIGRMTAPGTSPMASAPKGEARMGALAVAAAEHLGRTESLLTLVRAEARGGRLDPVVQPWAESLLAETRLLLDTPDGVNREMRALLEDLELILVQIVGVTETEATDGARAGVELDLALRGLEDNEVLPRIQAALPAVTLAGT